MIKSALTILAVAGTGVFAQSGAPTDPVATVDGQAIERQEFDRWMTIAARSTGNPTAVPDVANGYRDCIATKRKATSRKVADTRLRRECEEEYAQLRDQVMQLLISFRWISGEAAARNIVVTDAEVARDFEEQKRQSFPTEADFQKFIKTSGQRLEDILQRVKLDLLSNKLRDHATAGQAQVSQAEIKLYYTENRSQFAVPELRDLRIVLTKRRDEAARARAALEGGASWKAVTRRYSIDGETRRKAGRLPAQAEDTLDRTLDKAVFRAAKGQLVGPVRTQYGYYVFTVTRVEPARRQRFAEVKETIEQMLTAQAQMDALDAFVHDFTARWKAKTECAEGFTTSDCRNGPAAAPTPTPPRATGRF
ncbi:peptidyl-prolyl cis-trans isomerase [Solirubrobacter sp. CPCC 204708]|uniref:Peptidyl-prolyl cis-trans isomerase n=1 Tax=Solirubrobacter deserti TaxID=2282478 RepID=A0ABT4RFI7_9ACTN|nr:peptidyl-prolyl cis-trans isomerase [Solirubrobacter deserti]MBE2319411.1 peptidyl-prolyl cis-trans isomerase [Solirubrobacter deserti]MDA0137304.1 peptidyl-prolyl cis-trans isomerase [Solirubrobacter deserti]